MDSLANSGVSFPVFMAYGVIILLYLIILRLLLNLLQQMSDKHASHRSVIDRDVHRVMTNQVDTSMQTFNVYNIAIVIAKGGIAIIAMAIITVLLVAKTGVFATILLIVIVILLLYAYNTWAKSKQKAESMRSELKRKIEKSGNIGMILLLSILLVILLAAMIWLH